MSLIIQETSIFSQNFPCHIGNTIIFIAYLLHMLAVHREHV